jgi:hypothetical protein
VPARESVAFDGRGEALAPEPRGRSRSCCSVADVDRLVVVEPAVGATAPGGNSSAESVPASSSPEAATPANGELFAVAVEFAVDSSLA